jgi:hypothetical protein
VFEWREAESGRTRICAQRANRQGGPTPALCRDALVEEDPVTYYLREHYMNYPCVLVRLSRVGADALRDLVTGAHRIVSAKMRRKLSGGSRRRVAPRPRAREICLEVGV